MLASLFVTLREGFEAALIIAVVLAYLRQVGALGRSRSVWAGAAAAAAVSAAAGALLFLTGSELKGAAEALFEGVAMLAAVVVLSWMVVWMQRQARSEGARLRGRVDSALSGGGAALFGLAFLAVVREGLETALFLFAAGGNAEPAPAVLGAVIGLALAALLGVAVYRGSRWLPLRTFFGVTNLVLVGFGVYLVWAGVGELAELIGGEVFEVLGLGAAAAYGSLALLALRRAGRPSGAAERAPAHSGRAA
ncbi:MAG: FTR1 family protein [Thermoleophilia bacterium]